MLQLYKYDTELKTHEIQKTLKMQKEEELVSQNSFPRINIV